MNTERFNSDQLLMVFEYLLNQGSERSEFRSPKIFIDGIPVKYYFTEEEVRMILQLNGSVPIDFSRSIYLFEKYVEDFIVNSKKAISVPRYTDWIKEQNFRIIFQKKDITLATDCFM